jgi:hypothetical protein
VAIRSGDRLVSGYVRQFDLNLEKSRADSWRRFFKNIAPLCPILDECECLRSISLLSHET